MRFTTLLALGVAAIGFTSPAFAAADPACTAEIKSIMLATLSSGPYHVEAKITADSGDMTSSLELIPPKAMHSTSTVAGQETEMTFIDGKGYMKMGGTWTEMPKQMAGTMTQIFSPDTIETSYGALEKAECAVATDWQGTPALRYTFTTSVGGVTSDIQMWIDATTRLPLHTETLTSVNDKPMTSISDYRYDPAIEIKAPM